MDILNKRKIPKEQKFHEDEVQLKKRNLNDNKSKKIPVNQPPQPIPNKVNKKKKKQRQPEPVYEEEEEIVEEPEYNEEEAAESDVSDIKGEDFVEVDDDDRDLAVNLGEEQIEVLKSDKQEKMDGKTSS